MAGELTTISVDRKMGARLRLVRAMLGTPYNEIIKKMWQKCLKLLEIIQGYQQFLKEFQEMKIPQEIKEDIKNLLEVYFQYLDEEIPFLLAVHRAEIQGDWQAELEKITEANKEIFQKN